MLPRISFHLTTKFKSLSWDLLLGETNFSIPGSTQLNLYPKRNNKQWIPFSQMDPHIVDCFWINWLSFIPNHNPHPGHSPILISRDRTMRSSAQHGPCTVFHLSRLLWELTHAVDIKQHLAGLLWGNNKSDMPSSIILTILTPCVSCGVPAKVSDLL